MTDQVQQVSGQTPSQPSGGLPAVGDGQGVQQSSPDYVALQNKVLELEKRLGGLQADRDKVNNQNAKRIDDLTGTIQQYAQYAGIQIDPNAIRNMQLDNLLQGQAAPAPSIQTVGRQEAVAQPAVDYLAPLKVVGLDANDNEVLGLMVKHNGDQTAYNAALLALKTARLSQPPASAVAIPAPAGNVATNGKPSISDIKDPAKLYELAREQGAKLPGRNG